MRHVTRSILLLCLFFSLPEKVLAQENTLPDEYIISEFSGKAQSYSLSCESRSASDWAAFWGVHISETEFLNNLPSSDNPDVGFVGNVNDPWGYTPPRSYGVHAEPVAALLREYGLKAEARRGLVWEDLKVEIAAGRPVIVWVIGQMWGGQAREYTANDGKVVLVAPYEHTMILYGYTPQTVNVVDAYSGRKQTYRLDVFLKSWSVLGNMAVSGNGVELQHSTDTGQGEETYTVVGGEYLYMLAERFHIDWKILVTLNNLVYPYTLYPGQILRLPVQSTDGLTDLEEGDLEVDPTATMANGGDGSVVMYTVKPGDHLSRVAYQLGLNWQKLASYNDIPSPYTIYPGQVIRWSESEDPIDAHDEGGKEIGQETLWRRWPYYYNYIPRSYRIPMTWPW
ncbi:MAG: LysM peptidoglycan-binding domain-containing protein [Anaerolineales bacterium]|nr:LysM peptidoglycan-binding domain-containing protein [Anaerolineales bacterium]